MRRDEPPVPAPVTRPDRSATSRLVRRLSSGCSWLGATAVLLVAGRATALEPGVADGERLITVVIEGTQGCDDRVVFDAELARLLGDAATRGTRLDGRARIDRTADDVFRLRLALEQAGSKSERTLDGDCVTLLQTAALLVAITHDPSAVVERRAIGAPEAPAPTPPPVQPFVPVAPAAPAPPPALPPSLSPGLRWAWATPVPPADRDSILGFVARAGPLFGVGDLPGPHAGVAVGAGLRIDAYRVEGAFEIGAGSSQTVDARPDAGADFLRLAGVLRGCRVLVPLDGGAWPRKTLDLDLSGCVGLELGTLSGEGFGVDAPERGSAFWAAPRVDLRVGLGVVGPLGIAADVGVAVPLDPRRYVLRGGTNDELLVVHEPSVVAGRAGLLVELEL